MQATDAQNWQHHAVLVRDFRSPAERSDFYARVRTGAFIRLFRGGYFSSEIWEGLDADERYRTIVRTAAASADREHIYSHASAAALWHLPWVGEWPTRAHVTLPVTSGGRSKALFAKHTTAVPCSTSVIDGITVTTLARTVVDLARTQSFGRAVTIADAALRRNKQPIPGFPCEPVSRSDLFHELDWVAVRQGVVKARRVIHFADHRADRPGESMSRVSMALAGLPAPELQVEISGASGTRWTVDFFWPDLGLVGEFDGFVKYSKPEFLRGRTAAEVVVAEKDREDDLRAAGFRVVRWRWDVALSPNLMRERLSGPLQRATS